MPPPPSIARSPLRDPPARPARRRGRSRAAAERRATPQRPGRPVPRGRRRRCRVECIAARQPVRGQQASQALGCLEVELFMHQLDELALRRENANVELRAGCSSHPLKALDSDAAPRSPSARASPARDQRAASSPCGRRRFRSARMIVRESIIRMRCVHHADGPRHEEPEVPGAPPHRTGQGRRRQQVRRGRNPDRGHPPRRPRIRARPADPPRRVQGQPRPRARRPPTRRAPRRRARDRQPDGPDPRSPPRPLLDGRGLRRDAPTSSAATRNGSDVRVFASRRRSRRSGRPDLVAIPRRRPRAIVR
jgi:hypothetical protein